MDVNWKKQKINVELTDPMKTRTAIVKTVPRFLCLFTVTHSTALSLKGERRSNVYLVNRQNGEISIVDMT